MINNRQTPAGWSLSKGLLFPYGLATLLLFALAQALIVFGVPHTSVKGLLASQTQEAAADMSAMADARKNQLEQWVVERRGDLRAIAENPLLQAAVCTLQHQPLPIDMSEAGLTLRRLRAYITILKDSYYGEYSKIEIIDASNGKILASSRPDEEGMDASLPRYVSEALNPAVEEVVTNVLDEGSQSSNLIFARAIHEPAEAGGGRPHAVLVLHNTMDSIITHLLHEGIGRTGEIVLVDQDSRLMAPLRYPLADGSVARPLVFINPAKPASLAAQGVETVLETQDYRGVKVLAATRHLRVTSELAWGLVIKIDESEVYHPIKQTLVTHALVLGASMLAGGFIILLIATRLTTPLATLSRAAAAITAGDLSVRTVPQGSRELQTLSCSFNSMAVRLEHWHDDLATEVEKRTAELTAAHQALLESEKRYRRIVETSSEGIWLGDEEYRTIFVNPRMAAMLGYHPREMLGRPVVSFMYDEDQTLHHSQEASRKMGLSGRYERRFKRQDGSQLWARISATPIVDEHGEFKGALAMVSDISEQKRMADALRDNQARLDLALQSAGMGVFSTEIATGKRIFDDQACHIYGLEPHTFSGEAEDFFQMVHPDDREIIEAGLARTIAQDVPYEAEYRVLWPDGSVHFLAARGRLVRDGSGQAERINGIVWDVTSNRQAEEERKSLLQQLSQAQKMEAIGTLAGGIAHDFNNILAAILGYAELAKDDAPQPGGQFVHDIDQILLAGNRAKDLVKQILAFSRQSNVDRLPIKIQPLIKESLKLLRASLPATISIKENIHPQCGAIVADPTQVHQIMMNLCTNAFHAMETNGGVLQVSLTMATIAEGQESVDLQIPAGDYVELAVADTGTGIAQDVIDRIFDPYFTTKGFGKGTGMGLAITHGIVKSYGGGITVESALGQGTAFHVYFPVIAGQPPDETSETTAPQTGQEHILFIDDEEILAEMAKTMLERLGYHVTVRLNSIDALEVFMNSPDQFDLVITDQTMPGMTGYDLARRMLQIRPDVPIILCTGYSNLVDEELAKSLGIKGFTLKPLTKDLLAKLIREVLAEANSGEGRAEGEG